MTYSAKTEYLLGTGDMSIGVCSMTKIREAAAGPLRNCGMEAFLTIVIVLSM